MRTFATRWGWLLIIAVAAAVFFLEPTDMALWASRVLVGLAIVVAAVSVALKRKNGSRPST